MDIEAEIADLKRRVTDLEKKVYIDKFTPVPSEFWDTWMSQQVSWMSKDKATEEKPKMTTFGEMFERLMQITERGFVDVCNHLAPTRETMDQLRELQNDYKIFAENFWTDKEQQK